MPRITFSTDPPAHVKADVVVVPVFEGPEFGAGAEELGVDVVYRAARLEGKKREDLLVPLRSEAPAGPAAVLLVGVGEREGFNVSVMRRTLGRVAPSLARFGTVATTLPVEVAENLDAVGAAVEGLALGSYRFDRYRSNLGDEPTGFSKAIVIGSDRKTGTAGVKRAQVVAEAVLWARDLVNTPAGDLPPSALAREAQKMAKAVGLSCKVWSPAELERGGFGGILGVGAGSANPPRMIELSYAGAGAAKPLALSGKGVAFDSGGLSLKEPKAMETMKDDMAGAASILAAMWAVARLKPKIDVIAAIPTAENMPSGTATRPGDVLRHRGGRTTEVVNTDAEGRLILADALAYLAEKEPAAIIDVATLTGACVVALGDGIAGAFGNDDDLIAAVRAAGDAVGEPIWQLPLWRDYRPLIDSPVADAKNQGERYGGAITAALFLAEFVGEIPWVHLDIAGPGFTTTGYDLGPKGATGVPVRTLVRFILDRAGTRSR